MPSENVTEITSTVHVKEEEEDEEEKEEKYREEDKKGDQVDEKVVEKKEEEEEEEDEDDDEVDEEGKRKKKEKGYTCSICFEIFLSCGRFLAHKRKTGHGSVKCTSCLIFLPSVSARKKHATKTGHTVFDGILVKARDCRGVKHAKLKKAEGKANVEDSTDHFLDPTKVRKHQSQYITPVEEPTPPIFSPPVLEEDEFGYKEKVVVISVQKNIPEPVRPVFSFVPLNPFGQYDPMNPFWVPPPPHEEEEVKVAPVVVESPSSRKNVTPAPESKKPVKKEAAPLSKKALRSVRKGREGAEYTPFGKATAESDDKPFDLQFAFSYEAAAEHNLQLPELLVEDEVEEFPPPARWMLDRMHREWANTPANLEQWEYVQNPVPLEAEDRELAEGDNRDLGNERLTLADFEAKPEARVAALNRAEVVALRLYTGPGYKAINASTRTGDQAFCVTCFALESAIIKVAKNTKKANVVRGLSGKMSDQFQTLYAEGRPLKAGEVIADPGFLSTTRNLEVATTGNYKGNTLFLITGKSARPGLLRMGADVSWISQFPLEQEVLFPQYTELWYATKDKRDPKLDQKFGHLKKTQVYQFGARAKFNEEHSCPNIPGLTK